MSSPTASNQEIKELYERSIAEKYQNDYEFRRWFLTDRLRLDYFMTRTAIAHHLQGVMFSSCLEFGPGSGIFTATAYRRNPSARFDLIDISEAMKKQFVLEMRPIPNVSYMIGDIMEHDFGDSTYDLFYSVRAVEYVDDQEGFFKKVHGLLNAGGHGVIVTKNPHYGSAERGESTRSQHRGKLGVNQTEQLLAEVGFKNIQIYPVIIRLPIIERLTLRFTEKYFQRAYQKPFNKNMSRFVESYIVIFEK
ncbi:hypothetical protein BK004_01290 [bacterium CG10_46_32]|nr:MAG: hypothetical protein BK004_01290 [bacterium CG10_46_32]PIR56333.1 MAG: hypothetical protein COU73_01305 [Parcubacteria group bacterium CG10_big_fil_rev_8_21_14_0_10_46_32]